MWSWVFNNVLVLGRHTVVSKYEKAEGRMVEENHLSNSEVLCWTKMGKNLWNCYHNLHVTFCSPIYSFFFTPVITIKSAGTGPCLSLYSIKYVEIYIVALFSALYLNYIWSLSEVHDVLLAARQLVRRSSVLCYAKLTFWEHCTS